MLALHCILFNCLNHFSLNNIHIFYICRCGSSLYPYTTTICELLKSQLQWTKAMFSVSTDDNFIVSRSTLYENIHDFLSESSLSSMLTGMVGTLVEHTVYDLSLPSPTQVS